MASFKRPGNDGRTIIFLCGAEFSGPFVSPDLVWSVVRQETTGGEFQDLLGDDCGHMTNWNNGVAAYRKLVELGCPHDEAIRLVREAVREAVESTVGV